MEDIKSIKAKLARFQELWKESLEKNYKNRIELADLARQIRDAKCEDAFLISELTESERITYDNAIKLANAK